MSLVAKRIPHRWKGLGETTPAPVDLHMRVDGVPFIYRSAAKPFLSTDGVPAKQMIFKAKITHEKTRSLFDNFVSRFYAGGLERSDNQSLFKMKFLIATDAWHPQMNGVVRSPETTVACLTNRGHHVRVLAPDAGARFAFGLPNYAGHYIRDAASRQFERNLQSPTPQATRRLNSLRRRLWPGRNHLNLDS